MDADIEEQEDPLAGVGKLLLPKDKFLQVSHPVYQPSLMAQLLTSERTRLLFAEAVELESSKSSVPRLSELCNIVLAREFKSGKLPSDLHTEDLNYIGDHLDVNMPLIDIVDLDNEIYWKRVFKEKCNDIKLKCTKLHDVETDFKKEAIQVKLAEIIETTSYELWDDEGMINLSEAVAPYVFTLHITKLTPMKEGVIERDSNLLDYKMYNYPESECHHGSLEMLGYLSNLTELRIELLPPGLGYEYHRRFFLFSTTDIENLAKGLKRLTALNHLSIKRSRLDEKKMKILVLGLLHLPLETVEFSYCELHDKAGLCIGKLLQDVHSIKSLELEGNYLGKNGLEPIAFAMRGYEGALEYYGVARNPVTDDGVYILGSGLLGTNQVIHLNVNGIEVTSKGARYVVELLGIHPKLRKMDMCCLPLGEEGGDRFIELLKENKLLYHLESRGCEMNLDQEFKVRLLVSRNKYFFDNPILMEEVTSKEMESDANEWASRVKHPVLLKVNRILEAKKKCYKKREVVTSFKNVNPFFIHKQALVQKTNSELLKVHFSECSGLDSEIRLYTGEKTDSEKE
ncbi:unnamed protein product [Hermetia illucens]|uniref:Uncharacterized protein n=2 Tax=Hermetia illucens TaxID=343691 RepID=A0A7R8YNU1_HERIL|nr:unnamed protein product [Hermetia illucens]